MKRGQFYLLATIILIIIIAGFAGIVNFSQKKTNINFSYIKDEIEIESEKVLDYALNNNKTISDILTNFTKIYSTYSDADNLYFLFGNKDSMTFAGYKKLDSGSVFINIQNASQEIILNKNVYFSQSFSEPKTNMTITIEQAEYLFTLSPGENFYFIVSKEIESEKHVFTNHYSASSLASQEETSENETGQDSGEGFTQLTCIQYIIPQLCTVGVECPEGSQLFGDVTDCECGFLGGCKDQYTCVYFQTTSCLQNPTCPTGYETYSSQSCTP
mgnify:CR=1 FL=1|tara:strand:- start:1315 stop:2130 length:816 start_codon:yes stop_codon:yes gene_type:complete